MKKLVLVSLLALIAPLLNGQVLVEWDFDGHTGIGDLAGNLGTNVTGGILTRGTGATPVSVNDLFAAQGFAASLDLAGAISAQDYFSFSVNSNAGQPLNLTSLTYYMTKQNANSPDNFAVFTSVAGFTAGNQIGTFSNIGNGGFGGSLDLSTKAELQGVSGPIQVRIYAYGAATGGAENLYVGFGNQLGNDLVLNGEVIPEPSTYALIFGGLALGVVLIKRRLSRSKC